MVKPTQAEEVGGQTPQIILTKEEEERLLEIDRKVNGCPDFVHDEKEYHVSNVLKIIFRRWLDRFSWKGMMERISDEEREVISKVSDKVDEWWFAYAARIPEGIDLDIYDHGDNEMIIDIYVKSEHHEEVDFYMYDREKWIKSVVARFARVGEGWALTVYEDDKVLDLVEYIKSKYTQ